MIKEIGEKEITLKKTTTSGAGQDVKCLVKVVHDDELECGKNKIILQNSEDEKSIEITIGVSYPVDLIWIKDKNKSVSDGLLNSLIDSIFKIVQENQIGTIDDTDQFTKREYKPESTYKGITQNAHNGTNILQAVLDIVNNYQNKDV